MSFQHNWVVSFYGFGDIHSVSFRILLKKIQNAVHDSAHISQMAKYYLLCMYIDDIFEMDIDGILSA